MRMNSELLQIWQGPLIGIIILDRVAYCSNRMFGLYHV